MDSTSWLKVDAGLTFTVMIILVIMQPSLKT